MRTFKLSYPHSLQMNELPPTIAAIGFFDGIHLGHQKVIQTAVKEAKEKNMESAVITFHPHPSVILKSENKKIKYITPLEEKQEIIKNLHVDRLYIIEFSKDLSLLSPQKFIDHFIISLHIKGLIAGFDYTYGHKGQGNMENISLYANNHFTYRIIPKVELSNEKISSTRIRELLTSGKMEEVNTLLGRPFSLSGIVVEGDKRGRKIGYRTANLQVKSDTLLPKSGVYAVKVFYKNHSYEGIANIGVKPTFKDHLIEPSIEVHIFDFNQNVYGKNLVIQLIKYIRDEKKFNGIEELISQIKQDEQEVRTLFQLE